MLPRSSNHDPPTPPVGVIESLAQGFETVAGHLVLLLLPLLLDVFLWLGPRISLRPYYSQIWEPLVRQMEQEPENPWAELYGGLAAVVEGMPVIQYLPILGMPSLLAGREAASPPFDYVPPTWKIRTTSELMGVNLLSAIGGLILGSLYIAMVAQQVRETRIRLGEIITRLPSLLAQLLLLGVLVFVMLFAILVPFLILGLMLRASFPQWMAELTIVTGMVFVLWIGLFGTFTIHGMFMQRRRLFGAIWDSVRVVQWNLPATVFLVFLVFTLSWALNWVWGLADPGSWLALIAIGGNTFISTGLIAATFVFFKDRYRHWREMRDALLAELERRRAQQGQG
jgi:hypothetical protein